MSADDDFSEDTRDAPDDGTQLIVDLEGYEGPLDVLLDLARRQKVDLTQISILALADQYLAFIARVQRSHLELAADYLVMAAWLAYLKSRLLLPQSGDDEPSGPELAAALTFQLKRLDSMREAGKRLLARPRLGQEFFARGEPEDMRIVATNFIDVSLFDLLSAYGARRGQVSGGPLRIELSDLYTVHDAIIRLRALLGRMPEWETLMTFLPAGAGDGLAVRSALASTLAASLELARTGRVVLRQDKTFGPIYMRDKGGE